MTSAASEILRELDRVEQERERRAANASMVARVQGVKLYQQARFRHSYADMLGSRRFGAAAQFFLEELYGPQDFTERDAQFARVVPTLVRLFPGEIVATVSSLTRLHAISEELDGAMAACLPKPDGGAALGSVQYAEAWQRVGRQADREAQVALVQEIGAALDRYTRMPMLSASLKMMRGPARVAGLGSLQRFLEAGFDTFKAMRGADEFLQLIGVRERALIAALFDTSVPLAPGRHPALVQLP